MRLIEALASGIRGAENGTVDIYARGTSTRAQIYSDYDGSGAQTPSASLALDANGGLSLNGDDGGVYVNQAVRVVAKDTSGNVVRSFTVFDTATDVEVRSQSFTGTDYVTAARAAGNPALLSDVLDLVKGSFGTTDFNVVAGSATRTLTAALSAVTGVYFNVKDVAYGAVGNGIVDDTGSINAAIAAANAAGGQVFFPPGTYRVTSAMTAFNGAGGCIGANAVLACAVTSVLKLLNVSGGVNGQFYITGIGFSKTAGNAGFLGTTGTVSVTLQNVSVVGSTGTGIGHNSTGTLTVLLSSIQATAGAVLTGAGAGNVTLLGLTTDVSGLAGAITTQDAATVLTAAGCTFTNAGASFSYISMPASARAAVFGCTFGSPTSGTCNAYLAPGSTVTPNVILEFANTFGANVNLAVSFSAGIPATDATGDFTSMLSRNGRRSYQTTDANVTFFTNSFGICHLRRTGAGAQNILMNTTSFWENADTIFIFENDSGGSLSPVFLNTVVPAGGAFTVANARVRVFVLRTIVVSGVLYYVAISDSGDIAGI